MLIPYPTVPASPTDPERDPLPCFVLTESLSTSSCCNLLNSLKRFLSLRSDSATAIALPVRQFKGFLNWRAFPPPTYPQPLPSSQPSDSRSCASDSLAAAGPDAFLLLVGRLLSVFGEWSWIPPTTFPLPLPTSPPPTSMSCTHPAVLLLRDHHDQLRLLISQHRIRSR